MDVASGDHAICRMRPGGIGAGGHTGAMQGKEHTEIPLTHHWQCSSLVIVSYTAKVFDSN